MENSYFENTGGIVYPGLLKNFSKEDHDTVDKKIKDGSLELKSSADVDEKLEILQEFHLII